VESGESWTTRSLAAAPPVRVQRGKPIPRLASPGPTFLRQTVVRPVTKDTSLLFFFLHRWFGCCISCVGLEFFPWTSEFSLIFLLQKLQLLRLGFSDLLYRSQQQYTSSLSSLFCCECGFSHREEFGMTNWSRPANLLASPKRLPTTTP
jgi:hypothetical protein